MQSFMNLCGSFFVCFLFSFLVFHMNMYMSNIYIQPHIFNNVTELPLATHVYIYISRQMLFSSTWTQCKLKSLVFRIL